MAGWCKDLCARLGTEKATLLVLSDNSDGETFEARLCLFIRLCASLDHVAAFPDAGAIGGAEVPTDQALACFQGAAKVGDEVQALVLESLHELLGFHRVDEDAARVAYAALLSLIDMRSE